MRLISLVVAMVAVGCGSDKDDEGPAVGCAELGEMIAENETCNDPAEDYEAFCEESRVESEGLGCESYFDKLTECSVEEGLQYECGEDGEPSSTLEEGGACENEFGMLLACVFSAMEEGA